MQIVVASEGKGYYGRVVIDYLLKLAYGKNLKIIWKRKHMKLDSSDCQLLVRSNFRRGEDVWVKNPEKLPCIYWSGEPFLVKWKNECRHSIHLATTYGRNVLYTPYMVYSFNYKEPVRKITGNPRPYLVAYCSRHKVSVREKLFTLLCDKAPAGSCHALGVLKGESPNAVVKRVGGTWESDGLLHEYSKFKFVFALENCIKLGYITEKIVNAFKSGAIPIYWGDASIKSLINPKSFIYVPDFPTLEACAQHIVSMTEEQIQEMLVAPIFIGNVVPDILQINNFDNTPSYYSKMASRIKDLINAASNGPESKNINHEPAKKLTHFISYGDKKYEQSKMRIAQEAKNFGFDTVTIYGPEDLDTRFTKRFSHILAQPKGGGYWIWKPHVVQRRLARIAMGDYLVYCDAGCSINMGGKERFNQYLHMLDEGAKSGKSILGFELKHKESDWTAQDVFTALDANSDDIKNSGQLVGGILVIKKTPESIELIQKWNKTLHTTPKLFSIPAKKHRHDQSVFSVLRKKYGAIILPDETHPPSDGRKKGYPFLAARIRK